MSAKNIPAKIKATDLLKKRKAADQTVEEGLMLREQAVQRDPQEGKAAEAPAEQTFTEVYEKSVEATPAAEFAEPVLFSQAGEIGGTATGGGGIGAGATGAAGAAGAAAAASGAVAAATAGSAAMAGLGAGAGSGIAALGAGAAVAAAAASAGSAAALNNVKVIFVGGPAVPDHGLTVELFKADGKTKLGQATFNEKGEVTLQVGDYLGVVVGRILDADDGFDYFDEVAGPKDLSANLFTVGEIVQANSTITLNINVLTTIAFLKAQLAIGGAGKTFDSATVKAVNTAVAKAFGLDDLHDTTIIPTNSDDFDPNSSAKGVAYGKILANLSGLDDLNGGDTQKTIDDFVGTGLNNGGLPIASLTSTTAPTLSTAAQTALTNGANAVALPTKTISNIGFLGDTDLTTSQSSQTVTATLSATLSGNEKLWGSFDGGGTWFNLSNISGAVTGTAIRWENISLANSGSLQFRVVDDRGNKGPLASADYTFTGTALSTKISGIDISDDTGLDTDFITSKSSQTISATLSAALTTGQVLQGSVDGGATWSTVSVTGTAIQWATTLVSGTNNIVFKVVDGSGNSGAPAVQEYELDTTDPAAPTIDRVATNKVVPTITGTSELKYGEALTVEVNGATYRVFPKNDGSWTLDLATAKPTSGTLGTFTDGTYSVIAKVTDKAGNSVSDGTSSELVVDTTAPVTPSAPSGYQDDTGSVKSDSSTAAITDDTNPGILVGIGLTDTPKLYVNGTLVAATYDSATGTLTPTVALSPDGSCVFTYTLTDAAGNESGQSGALNVSVDTAGPTTTISGIDISDDTGTSATDFITKTASQTVTATLSAALVTGEKLYGSVDNGVSWIEITDKVSNGTSVNWNTATLSGSSSIKLEVRDAAGNSGTAATQAYTLDTTGPTKTIGALDISDDTGTSATDFITKTAAQTVTATLSAALASGEELYGSVDNGANWIKITDKVSGTAVSWNTATLSGSSSIKLEVRDAAGNSGTAATQAYTLDTTAPNTPSSAPASYDDNAGNITNTASTALVTDDTTPGINVGAGLTTEMPKLYIGGNLVAATYDSSTGMLTPDVALTAGGPYAFTYKLMDAAGNLSEASPALSITITLAPTTTISGIDISDDTGTSATDFITKTAAQTVTATLSAALASGEELYGSVDNGANWIKITDKVSGTAVSWNTATLSGSSSIKLEVRDAESRAGTAASQAYTLDTTGPTLDSITDSFSGTADGPITYTFTFSERVSGFAADNVSVSSGTKGTFTKVSDTVYTLVVDPGLGNGTITTGVTTASFKDFAGNDGTSTGVTNTQAYATLTKGQSVINLGTYGKLINPVQVDGDHWFYYWDRDGDGVTTGTTNFPSPGTPTGDTGDMLSMDQLETIFFGSNTGAVMTETNREWVYSGLTLKLPTASGTFAGAWRWDYANAANGLGLQNTVPSGTAIGNGSDRLLGDTSVNSVYDDLIAIWDAYNGTGTTSYYSTVPGVAINGLPQNWAPMTYLSATRDKSGYLVGLTLNSGATYNYEFGDGSQAWVALEVVFPLAV